MHMGTRVTTSAFESTSGRGVVALRHCLDQLGALLSTVDARAYVARPAASVSGSVGEHVRHALDHVSALVAMSSDHALSYDHRYRGTSVESDPGVALQQTLTLCTALERWSAVDLDLPIQLVTTLTADGTAMLSWSTLGREVAFVINHTIHHQALIGVLLAWQGLAVPERFGYAPTTPPSA